MLVPNLDPLHSSCGTALRRASRRTAEQDGAIGIQDLTEVVVLWRRGAHEHPSLTSPDKAPPGNGLLLFFRVDDFDKALMRARALVTRLDEEPHVSPNTQTPEFSLRDPDGYYVTINAL
jgi:hypothetical protein